MLTRVTILALVAAAAAIPAPEAEPIRVPHGRVGLEERADGTADWAAFLTELNNTLIKYKSPHHLYDLSRYVNKKALLDIEKRAVKKLPLVDQANDLTYYGNAQVGAKRQTFTVNFDTGSSDFFVPGPGCGSKNGCHGTPYSQSGIKTNKKTSVTYGSGSVSGNNYFDTVCVAGLCAPHTNLISLTNAQGFATQTASSLMGMGFSTIAASKEPTFFENLIKAGKVTKPEFSFYLGRKKSGTGGKSQMVLGGVDRSKFKGKPKAHKVTKKGYWQLAVGGLSVNGKKQLLSGGQGAIDTGTTVIIAPTVATLALFKSIPGAVPLPLVATGSATQTAFAIPCGLKTKVGLVFDNVNYAINPLDLNIGQIIGGVIPGAPLLGGLCIASIIAADIMPGQEFFVVGDTFLKNWHSTFSYAKGASVSFAKAV